MIRVIIADDSATARELLCAILERDGDIQVVALAHDGGQAVQLVEEHAPDLVVMDVHMPVLDGLAATREIMHRTPTPIVMVSAVNTLDVDLSLTATQAGALMALPKPEGPHAPRFDAVAEELRGMVRAMSQVKVVRRWGGAASASESALPVPSARRPTRAPELIAMAASTGGPAALRRVLLELPAKVPVPILVVQHIASDFTAGFAEWLGKSCALRVRAATQGEPFRLGVVYIAPENMHLGVTPDGRAQLADSPPIGGFRPSATHLFESAGRAYGSRLAAVILTGMGTDGADGLEVARAQGAYVLAQDEASSVVFGMAREAVRRGAVDAVLPLGQIAPRLRALMDSGAEVP